MNIKPISLAIAVLGTGFTVLSGASYASGYHFGTQSVSAQATANASAAEANDATTLFYNPAGMTRLKGTQFSGALNLVAPSVKYSNASGNYPNQPARNPANPSQVGIKPGTDIAGSTGGKITDDLIVVPQMYLTHQINDRITAGLGIYVPFASETDYERTSVLRYNVNQTSLTTIDINPTIAFKLNDQHSVAVGLIAQRAEAELRQYANFAGAVLGIPHGVADGYAEVEGDDWGFGFNLGWLWEIDQDTRIGLSYRSPIKHTLKGKADWTTPSSGPFAAVGAVAQANGYIDSDVSVDIKTPESLSLHGYKKIDPKWAVMADLTWTKHSRFDKVDIQYAVPKNAPFSQAVHGGVRAPATTLNPKWDDTWKLAIGASYQYSDPLQLRFGVAYDKSPVPSEDFRMSTMPDNDRIWFSVGGRYDFDKKNSLNVAYSYVHIKDSKAKVNGYCGGATAGAVNCVSSYTTGQAEYKSHAHILGVQYNYHF